MNGNDVLLTLLAEIEVFAEVPENLLDAPGEEVEGMVTAGVPYRPAAWLNMELSGSQRMAMSRLVRRLERDGLVRRLTEEGRDRVTHLVPTLAGLERALQTAGSEADRDSVLAGLRRTNWGVSLARQLDTPRTWDEVIEQAVDRWNDAYSCIP